MKRRREFRLCACRLRHGAPNQNLVHHEYLWDVLRFCRTPARIISLLSGLYSRADSAGKCGVWVSSLFSRKTWVMQRCVLAPSVSNTCMDWLLSSIGNQSPCGAGIGDIKATYDVGGSGVLRYCTGKAILWDFMSPGVWNLAQWKHAAGYACVKDTETSERSTKFDYIAHSINGLYQDVFRWTVLTALLWNC